MAKKNSNGIIHNTIFNIFFIVFRLQRIEDYRKSFNRVETDLNAFVESLQDLKTERQSEIGEIYEHHTGTCIEMQNIIKLIVKNGK